jgi:hypothetical protein
MTLVWFVCALGYAAAGEDGLIGPTNPRIYADPAFEACGDGGDRGKIHWTDCKILPPEHSTFDPLIYSLDVILPVVDLKQETEWSPMVHSAGGEELVGGHELRLLLWVEIFFGWIGSLLLVSVLGGLIKRD